jgi:aminoglycoside phosphotransferase family enzyme/predicted kinase
MGAPSQVSSDGQAGTIAFLARADSYPGSEAGEVAVIETHISVVFLAGSHAYKLKRAVQFPYLDFTSLGARKEACARELRLNRRGAPDLYLGLMAVVMGADGTRGLFPEDALPNGGDIIDWLVCMRRFDQDMLFDRLAERGGLSMAMMETLAREIHALHGSAEIYKERGGAAAAETIIANNLECLDRFGRQALQAGDLKLLAELSHRHLECVGALLDARRAAGFVRQCHGDLHLRNIVLIDDAPVLFDGIEFSDDFSIIDVLYDFAFLVMDLCHKGLTDEASAVFNRTIDLTGDVAGLAAMPLFLSMRAAVRSHVAAATGKASREAAAYLAEAIDYLAPPAAKLVAVGGLSGTGKSTLAAPVAAKIGAAPGALVLRSDVIRKRLAGADLFEKLAPEDYSKAMTERVFGRMIDDARIALMGGQSVILDAVYADADQRRDVARLADEMAREIADFAGFSGFWLHSPLPEREQRIARRTGNVSDATVAIARRQEGYDQGAMDWTLIDASGDIEIMEKSLISELAGASAADPDV